MGLFNSLTKLFRKDTQVGITTTTSSEDIEVSTTSSIPSAEVSITSSRALEETPAMPTADEINIALEMAAAADRLEIEDNLFDLQPDPSIKKKKTTSKKPNSKLPRKSTSKRKKN
jgi:hypothetical protein